MKSIFLFLTLFCFCHKTHGQNFSLNQEFETEKLIYQKISEYKLIVFISEVDKLYIESYPSLKKTVIRFNGKQDTLIYYIAMDYFSGAYRSKLRTKKKLFLILTNFPPHCLGLACSVSQTSIIELSNSKIHRILCFSTFRNPLELMKVKHKKLYVHILRENNIVADYLGIKNEVFLMTTFRLNKRFKLVYDDNEANGCYELIDKKNLKKRPCPFGYRPMKDHVF